MSNALVLYMKAPRPGTVKTRLTPRVSAGEAAELYRAFILDTLHLAQGIAGASLFVAWTPEDGLAELRSALGNPDVEWTGQRGRDLGERLSNTFAVLGDEWDKIVVLGGDSPLLPPAYVEEAFAALDRHDVVLGPAEDGGYYLIGLGGRGVRGGTDGTDGRDGTSGTGGRWDGRTGGTERGGKAERGGTDGTDGRDGTSGTGGLGVRGGRDDTGGTERGGKAAGRYARLFESIHWGTGSVLRQTRAAVRACGFSCHELPDWHDVDRPADLDRVAREIRALRAGGDRSTGRCTESALEAVNRRGRPA